MFLYGEVTTVFQLYKNIKTGFLGEICLELFQFKTQSLFWDTLYGKEQ